MRQGAREVEYTGDYLVQLGVVESLVAEDRIPWVIDTGYSVKIVRLTQYGADYDKCFPNEAADRQLMCVLPPKGVCYGDRLVRSTKQGFAFYSSEGEPKGTASMFAVTPEQAREIKALTRIALASNLGGA